MENYSADSTIVTPIGTVRSPRLEATDDFWGDVISTIELDRQFTSECTMGLSEFSHIEVVYSFHKVAPSSVVSTAGHPRERQDWPKVGIFAQRKKNRPNRLGVSICRLLKVDDLKLTVQALDAIDGTPILDIKPFIREFQPSGATKQPEWSTELMTEYFIAKLFYNSPPSFPDTRIDVGNGYFLNAITPRDRPSYLEYLNEREIYDRTLSIPFPYTDQDADFWFQLVAAKTKENGRAVQFALRTVDGKLIGGIGFDGLVIGQTHKAELGYWLAKPFWGKGIMTQAVRGVCKIAFSDFGLERITANIFAFNTASQKVLEKNGFAAEGYFKKHYRKGDSFFDGKIFALLREATT